MTRFAGLLLAAREAHHFLSVTKQGLSAIVCTAGNDACHVILRGGATGIMVAHWYIAIFLPTHISYARINAGPNYSAQHVHATASKLQKAGVRDSIMIDCSHGNSEKQFRRQITVAADIAKQLSGDLGVDGVSTANAIFGVMLE